MAKKIIDESETIFCSECGDIVGRDEKICENCGEELEDSIIEGKQCPRCDRVVEIDVKECPNCGRDLSFPPHLEKEDEKFLSKLLGWGDETENRLKEKLEDREKAIEIVRKFSQSNNQNDSGLGIELDEEINLNVNNILEPFNVIIKKTNKNINDIQNEIVDIEKIDEKTDEDTKKIKLLNDKKKELSQLLDELQEAKGIIENKIKKEEEKLQEKRRDIIERIDDFRQSMPILTEEISEMEEKRRVLIKKENDLKKWENNLENWNEKLEEKESELIKEKKSYEEGEVILDEIQKEIPEENGVTREEWISEQKKIQQQLLNLREMWGEDDFNITEDSIPQLKRKLKKKEEEWENKIKKLEKELEEVRKEKEKLEKKEISTDVKIEEIEKVLTVLDQLLGNLPEDKIEEFAKSEDFELYEKILDAFEI